MFRLGKSHLSTYGLEIDVAIDYIVAEEDTLGLLIELTLKRYKTAVKESSLDGKEGAKLLIYSVLRERGWRSYKKVGEWVGEQKKTSERVDWMSYCMLAL